jgi:hypothetical protein
LSNTSALLVAAKTITLELVPKPSISVSNWFSVFSRSSFPLTCCFPLALPTASISSIKIIAGDFSFLFEKDHVLEKHLHPQTSQQNQNLIREERYLCFTCYIS